MTEELDVLKIITERLEAGHVACRRNARRDQKMNDTSAKMERLVAERYRQMNPDQRLRIASSMFDTSRKIVESSLPPNLTRRERRLAFARRLYAGELPEAALQAFADWTG